MSAVWCGFELSAFVVSFIFVKNSFSVALNNTSLKFACDKNVSEVVTQIGLVASHRDGSPAEPKVERFLCLFLLFCLCVETDVLFAPFSRSLFIRLSLATTL